MAVVAAGALSVVGVVGGLAQEATPTAESPLAGLGLPELVVTATDAGFEVDQTEIPAGRYLVTLNNESATPEIAAGFVQLPEGRTLEELSYADELAGGTPPPEEMPPIEDFAWLFDTYVAGGPSSLSDHSRQAVVNLPAGNYGIWGDDPTGSIAAAALTVTGEADAEITGPEPEAAVTFVETGEGGVGYEFEVQGEIEPGPQVVEIVNASDQPHFVEALQYPEEITVDQVMAAFMFDPSTGATPSPDMLDFEQMSVAGWASTQSAGTTQWVVMNLQPGRTMIACFVPDPLAGGIPHALEGMVEVLGAEN
jgi:hypothetical protein